MKKFFLSSLLILSTFVFSQHVTYYSSNPTENLFKAIAAGNTKGVFDAVAKGANVNATCKISPNKNECFWKNSTSPCSTIGSESWDGTESFTPLYIATKTKQAEIVQVLLELGADVNATSKICSVDLTENIPFAMSVKANAGLFYSEDVDDKTLLTAMVYDLYGIYDTLYTISSMINSSKVSDKMLADFIEQVSQHGCFYSNILNDIVSADEENIMTSLDLAISANKPLTAEALRAIGAKSVDYYEKVGECNEQDDMCWGPLMRVRYNDGSEETRTDFCSCGT